MDPAAPTPYGYPVVHTAYGYDAYGYPMYYYDGGPFTSTTESCPVGISAIPHFKNARTKNYSQPQHPADPLLVVPTSSSTHSDAKSNLPAVLLHHSTSESLPRKSFDRAATRKRKPKTESLVWVIKTPATKGNERSGAGMEGEQLH